MLANEQAATLAFLEEAVRDGGGLRAEVVETHISLVVLGRDRVFKLKRAVRLPYLDFSTPEQRLAACRKEDELNRRTAPTLYRGVRRITREASGLAFDGDGTLVDAVVEMARFDGDGLFDKLAQRGALTPALLTRLARSIADFHQEAAVNREIGGADSIAAVLDINERAFATSALLPAADVAALNAAARAALARHSALLDRRARDGHVRRCHGDLHLRNICLVDGEPTLFDCLEFDEAMATIDVLYDLAFLLMDLWHRRQPGNANFLFNRYLDACDEADGLPLLPFFMSLRAAVRAHVSATSAATAPPERRDELAAEAAAYLALARDLLEARPARLVGIGGFSGTGKSTVAAGIADRIGPAPGARVLSTDRIRKRLCGVTAETRLSEDAYRPEMSERVYGELMQEAAKVLACGHAVIADGVFDRPADRATLRQIAGGAGIAFNGLWLEAASEVLVSRVHARCGDPSDATADVVRAQLARPSGAIEWAHTDSARGSAAVARDIFAQLGFDDDAWSLQPQIGNPTDR